MAETTATTKAMPFNRRDFIARLAAGVLAINLMVAGLAGFHLQRSRQQYENRATTQIQNLAQSLSITLDNLVDRANLAIFSVSQEAERQLRQGGIDGRSLNAYILRHKERLFELDGLRVANARGEIVYGDGVIPELRRSMATRDYFIYLRDHPRSDYVLTKPLFGLVSKKWVFEIVRRIDNPDGSFAGVVYAAISIDYLQKIFSSFDLGKDGVITLRDAELTVIARYPESHSIGSNTVSPQMRALVRAGRTSATYLSHGSIDTTARIFSYRKVDNYPLYVNVGRAPDVFMAPWRAEAKAITFLVAVFAAGTLMTARLMYRNRRREAETQAELLHHQECLEETVHKRTAELEAGNARLTGEIALRRQAEADLKRAAVIMDRMQDAVDWLSRDGTYLYVNDAACRMHGYSREEMLALSVWDVAPRFPSEAWPAHWEELKREGHLHFETVNRRRDGHEFPVEVSANYLEIDGREYNCAIIRDISERKAAEAERQTLMTQLGQSQKIESIGRLAGGIAHDFNNLLTPILVYAEMVRNRVPDGTRDAERLEGIIQAADKARMLTQQLLSFGRKQVLEMKILDLNKVIRAFHDILRRTIRENIAIHLHLAEGEYGIRADHNQVEQIIMNLAINAQDAMDDKGSIAIETAPVTLDDDYARLHAGVTPGRYLMLAVTDTGSGMSPETLDHLFEPFFTTKPVGKGTGLGLATVYGLVRQHEGHIWVYSEVGRGTVFKIYFPLADGAPAEEETPAADFGMVHAGDHAILLVEDNDMVRQLVCDLLNTCGCQVIVAEGPRQALALSAGRPVDLLLTDVVMPGMNGPELYRTLLETHNGLKVLYMSGYTDNAIVHHGVLDEGINFIQKPFTVKDLARKIDAVLRS
ncbi:hybrid sensor histidine kinase/response regulator [Geobacter sp. AOG2]|uniref:hybrid sensor histidine kinase/response regulator n=1 Tax=Geobacter sp. AOG2 TaxID=1566347 RepID=UPI001CC74A33|nr:hybrid sensor histidine kinase/response regulator [Geobacter sp. AOG2]GFE62903.1 hypothetical protein AOG2_34920 [Geobacter sp. AOG2]